METSTRERLVIAATELFWSTGYEATSLGSICERAGANPGSLYYFFPSKEELLQAVLDRLEARLEPDLLDPAWQDVSDPIDRIVALLDAYRSALIATDLTYGCPIGGLALELRDPSEAVRVRLAANFEAWRGAVLQCFLEAQDRFPPDTNFGRLATAVLTVMEGGVMQARTFRDITPFDEGVQFLRKHLSLLTESRSPVSSERESSSPAAGASP